MSEVRLDEVLERLPSGLPLPLGCWLVGRVASCIAAQPRPVTPMEVRIREDGGVRVADPARDELPFAYRAPEVIRGGEASPRAAVFTLGALLVETVTGRSPFLRGSDMETRIAVAEEQVAPLTGRVGQASGRLDEIVASALAKDPSQRPGSTVELAERLDGFLDEELLDVGPEELVTAVRAAFAGVDLWTAMRDPGSVVAPLPSSSRPPARASSSSSPHPEPVGTRRHRAGPTARASSSAHPQPVAPTRRAEARSDAASSRPRHSPATTPVATLGGGEPRRPVAEQPREAPPRAGAEPSRPASLGQRFEQAELDLRPEGRRTSAPNKPRLDEEVVRLGDPLQQGGAAGITDAAVTGVQAPESIARPRPAAGVLDIDRDAFARERQRPATMIDDAPAPEPGPNWVKRIGIALIILLLAAIAYQYALRPLLRD